MNEIKKPLIILGAIVLFVLAIVFVAWLVEEEPIPREGPTELIAKLEEALESESNTLVYLGITTCPACNRFEPVLEYAAEKHNFEYIHFALDLMDNNDVSKVYNMLNLEQSPRVPFVAIVNNDGVVETHIGHVEYDTLFEFLMKNNIVGGN